MADTQSAAANQAELPPASIVSIIAGSALVFGVIAYVISDKRPSAKPNDPRDPAWWFQRSPEAALMVMPIVAPSYYGGKYLVKRYAPRLGKGARRAWDVYLPEEDAATAEMLAPYRQAVQPRSQTKYSTQELIDILNGP